MSDVQPSILSSCHNTSITITGHKLNTHHTRHSRATQSLNQHGISTATRHALLAATTVHGQPARHATTSIICVPKSRTTLPAATKWSSAPNANRWRNNLQQLHKPAFVCLHSLKGTRLRPSRIAPLSKTRSNGRDHRDDSPWWRFNSEHMLGKLQLPRVWSRRRCRDHRCARRQSSHPGHGHGAILLGLESDLGKAGSGWGVGVL